MRLDEGQIEALREALREGLSCGDLDMNVAGYLSQRPDLVKALVSRLLHHVRPVLAALAPPAAGVPAWRERLERQLLDRATVAHHCPKAAEACAAALLVLRSYAAQGLTDREGFEAIRITLYDATQTTGFTWKEPLEPPPRGAE